MEQDRVAVITESGNGLAESFANILLANKYTVILAASEKSYDILSKEEIISKKYELIEVDFKSEESLSQLEAFISSRYGHLDLLVNNAEIANGFGQKIDQIKLEEVRELYEVNLFSVIKLIQLLKPLLEKSDDPSIINISSSMGDINKMSDQEFCYSDYCMTAYASSKAALEMYTHLQGKEFKSSKIYITTFDPIVPNNCTHNSVKICDSIESEFISLIKK